MISKNHITAQLDRLRGLEVLNPRTPQSPRFNSIALSLGIPIAIVSILRGLHRSVTATVCATLFLQTSSVRSTCHMLLDAP